MALLVPCIKGRIGSTDYYQATMPARELVTGARPASELDEWASMGIEERMQRELDMKRVLQEIAPYIARSEDRFFGSVIVLVYKGNIEFEGILALNIKVPAAYNAVAGNIGFLTIDGGSLIVLDGQHRLAALEKVIRGDVKGPYALDVPEDKISVIFIDHESSQKTRRIFNKVNRYAKTTSRGDNIITSEDDGYAVISRFLLEPDNCLGNRDSEDKITLVNWISNTLSGRSTKLTTISAVYETVRFILGAFNHTLTDLQIRPTDEELMEYQELAQGFWTTVLNNVKPYQDALANPEGIPEMRADDQPFSLLFKPAVQIAFFQALARIVAEKWLTLEEATTRANSIDWCMKSKMWVDIIMRSSGSIDATKDAREITALLITYLLAADKMSAAVRDKIEMDFNKRKNYSYDNPEPGEKPEPLPKPVVSV